MTGAAVPEDANLVIRREDVAEREKEMEVGMKNLEAWRPWLNIARQGEDLRAGELVIDKPCRCDPAVMGLLATLGKTTVTVARGPEVGLITTGKVRKPGKPRADQEQQPLDASRSVEAGASRVKEIHACGG
jgi:molybdopterin molybdotransferase